MSLIVDPTANALEQAMDLRLKRQELLGSNMANIDTPGYQPRDLKFEGELIRIIENDSLMPVTKRTDGEHMGMGVEALAGADSVEERPDIQNSLDGNGVDLDREMARVADNSMRYNATLEMQRRRVGILNYSIMKMGEAG
jgi:flagellar basal-body rod protein FlgB